LRYLYDINTSEGKAMDLNSIRNDLKQLSKEKENFFLECEDMKIVMMARVVIVTIVLKEKMKKVKKVLLQVKKMKKVKKINKVKKMRKMRVIKTE